MLSPTRTSCLLPGVLPVHCVVPQVLSRIVCVCLCVCFKVGVSVFLCFCVYASGSLVGGYKKKHDHRPFFPGTFLSLCLRIPCYALLWNTLVCCTYVVLGVPQPYNKFSAEYIPQGIGGDVANWMTHCVKRYSRRTS